MAREEHPVKGISRHLRDTDLPGEPLHIHTELAAGSQSHPPHKHGGYEAIYMLEGEAVLDIGNETYLLSTNESAVFDPQKLHGLRNDTDQPMRSMVILYRDDV